LIRALRHQLPVPTRRIALIFLERRREMVLVRITQRGSGLFYPGTVPEQFARAPQAFGSDPFLGTNVEVFPEMAFQRRGTHVALLGQQVNTPAGPRKARWPIHDD